MNILTKTASLAVLTTLFSACINLNSPSRFIVDNSINTVNYKSIKSIPDITTVALEWQKVNDNRVNGYNIYRGKKEINTKTLKLIKVIDNRYTTHFVDSGLEPNTNYIYQISSRINSEKESRTTDAFITSTLPRISPVVYLQALSDLPKSVKILWRPHEDKRVKYYKVEKYLPKRENWVTLSIVNGRTQVEYIDKNLKDNTKYKYRVTAYTYNDVASLPSSEVVAKTKKLPIEAQVLKASKNLPKKIRLTWHPSPNKDIAQYRIYRSPFQTLGFSEQKTVPASTLFYTDTILEDGKQYFYKVLAVDSDNLESSTEIKAVSGQSLAKPLAPTITFAQIDGGKAIIQWSSPDNRAVSYNLYKTVNYNLINKKYFKYLHIAKAGYIDSGIQNGVDYDYRVEAVDKYGLKSNLSKEVTLSIPKTIIKK